MEHIPSVENKESLNVEFLESQKQSFESVECPDTVRIGGEKSSEEFYYVDEGEDDDSLEGIRTRERRVGCTSRCGRKMFEL